MNKLLNIIKEVRKDLKINKDEFAHIFNFNALLRTSKIVADHIGYLNEADAKRVEKLINHSLCSLVERCKCDTESPQGLSDEIIALHHEIKGIHDDLSTMKVGDED